jgi:hypothetical protein
MTVTCSLPRLVCPETDDADDVFMTGTGLRDWTPVPSRGTQSLKPVLLAHVFNALHGTLFSVAIKEFVDAVSAVPEVEEVVLFHDGEGTHLWTALRSRDWDAETAVLVAHSRLRRAYHDDIDLFIPVARKHELAETSPAGYVSLYICE